MEIEICPGAEIGSGWLPIRIAGGPLQADLPARGEPAGGRPAAAQARAEETARIVAGSGHKVLLVIVGGVRHDESFSPDGLVNIPHLSADLLPQSLLYRMCATRE